MPVNHQMLEQLRNNNRDLTKVWLVGAKLTDGDIVNLVEALSNNTIVETLYLSDNEFGDVGVRALAQLLRNNTSLKATSLIDNQLDYQHARWLAEAIAENTSLTRLTLTNNRIGDLGVHALCEMLVKNKSMQQLDLDRSGISDIGAAALGECLRSDARLKSLSLSNSCMSDVGVRHIAEGLKSNDTLVYLGLDKNRIGDEGAQALGEMLVHNRHLKRMILDHCYINASQLAALASGLKMNTGLESLFIPYNHIGNEGVRQLAELIKVNRTLFEIALDGANLESENVLLEAVKGETVEKRNYVLKELLCFEAITPDIDRETLVNRKFDYFLSAIRNALVWGGKGEADYYQDVTASIPPILKFPEKTVYEQKLIIFLNTFIYFRLMDLTCQRESDHKVTIKNHYDNTLDVFNALRQFMETMIDPSFYACLPLTHPFNQLVQQMVMIAVIKSAQLIMIESYEDAKLGEYVDTVLKGVYLEIYVPVAWRVPIQQFIASIISFRHAPTDSVSAQGAAVIEAMTSMLSITSVNYAELPETHYLKEYQRIIIATVDRVYLDDVEAQMNALLCIIQPFVDPNLRVDADRMLMSFAYFEKNAADWFNEKAKRALDLLTLTAASECTLDFPRFRPVIESAYQRVIDAEIAFDFKPIALLKDNDTDLADAIDAYLDSHCGVSELAFMELRQQWCDSVTETVTNYLEAQQVKNVSIVDNPNLLFTQPAERSCRYCLPFQPPISVIRG